MEENEGFWTWIESLSRSLGWEDRSVRESHVGDDNGAHHVLPGWGKHPDAYEEAPVGDDLEAAHESGDRPKAKLGKQIGRDRSVYFDPDLPEARLANAHLTITGESGTGKTQAMKTLLADLHGYGVPALVLDFKDDYAEPKYAATEGFKVYDPTRRPLPFNPLEPSKDPQTGEANKTFHTYQLVEILGRIYHLGELQQHALREAIKQAYVDAGEGLPNFDQVKVKLEAGKGNNELLGHLAPIFDFGFFSDPDPQGLAQVVSGNTVIRLAQLPGNEVKNSVAEFFLMALYNYLVRLPQTHLLRQVLVLDEAWRVVNSPFLEPLMRESRAFGLGIFVATQFPTDLPLAVSGSAATDIYFGQSTPDQIAAIQRTVVGGVNGSEPERLATEVRGLLPLTCIMVNKQYSPYVKVEARPYYARGFEATAVVSFEPENLPLGPPSRPNLNLTKNAHDSTMDHEHLDEKPFLSFKYTHKGPIKPEHIDEFRNDPRWLGFGFLGEANGNPEMHAALAEAANKVGVSHEDLFHWANSKLGRWAGEEPAFRKCPNCAFKHCPKCSHSFYNESADPKRTYGDEDSPCTNCGVDMKEHAKKKGMMGDIFRTQPYSFSFTSTTCECGSKLSEPFIITHATNYGKCRKCNGDNSGCECGGSGIVGKDSPIEVPYERKHLVDKFAQALPGDIRQLKTGKVAQEVDEHTSSKIADKVNPHTPQAEDSRVNYWKEHSDSVKSYDDGTWHDPKDRKYMEQIDGQFTCGGCGFATDNDVDELGRHVCNYCKTRGSLTGQTEGGDKPDFPEKYKDWYKTAATSRACTLGNHSDCTASSCSCSHHDKTAKIWFPPCKYCDQTKGFESYPFAQGMLQCKGCGGVDGVREVADRFNGMVSEKNLDLDRLNQAQGYAKCPSCDGDDPDCRQCQGSGITRPLGAKTASYSICSCEGQNPNCPDCEGSGIIECPEPSTVIDNLGLEKDESFTKPNRTLHRGADVGNRLGLWDGPTESPPGWRLNQEHSDQPYRYVWEHPHKKGVLTWTEGDLDLESFDIPEEFDKGKQERDDFYTKYGKTAEMQKFPPGEDDDENSTWAPFSMSEWQMVKGPKKRRSRNLYKVCPDCDGDNPDCEECDGSGVATNVSCDVCGGPLDPEKGEVFATSDGKTLCNDDYQDHPDFQDYLDSLDPSIRREGVSLYKKCERCNGDDPDCKKCQGSGLMSAKTWVKWAPGLEAPSGIRCSECSGSKSYLPDGRAICTTPGCSERGWGAGPAAQDNLVPDTCPRCKGTGDDGKRYPCNNCKGTGQRNLTEADDQRFEELKEQYPSLRNKESEEKWKTCSSCEGKGKMNYGCDFCEGYGEKWRRPLEGETPPGWSEWTKAHPEARYSAKYIKCPRNCNGANPNCGCGGAGVVQDYSDEQKQWKKHLEGVSDHLNQRGINHSTDVWGMPPIYISPPVTRYKKCTGCDGSGKEKSSAGLYRNPSGECWTCEGSGIESNIDEGISVGTANGPWGYGIDNPGEDGVAGEDWDDLTPEESDPKDVADRIEHLYRSHFKDDLDKKQGSRYSQSMSYRDVYSDRCHETVMRKDWSFGICRNKATHKVEGSEQVGQVCATHAKTYRTIPGMTVTELASAG